jgi:tetratricopeptide (TPR) repeat protein
MRGSVFAAAMTALSVLACASAASADCQLQNRGQWPITMAGGMATVPAQINGQHARLFIDTGSFFSTLAPASADRFKLQWGVMPAGFVVSGSTGAVRTKLATAQDFSVGGADYHRIQFLVSEHQIGATDGLIGQNMLGNVDVEYDFAGGALRLFSPKGCDNASLAYWARDTPVRVLTIDPIIPSSNQIHATAELNGVKIRVIFDTGAQRSVLSQRTARRLGVRTDGPNVVEAGAMSGVGSRLITTFLVPFNSFSIGGEQVKDTRLLVADVDTGDDDMLLGADFFLSHRILVSPSQSRLYFTYNGGPVFDLRGGHEADTTSAPPVVAAATPGAASEDPTDVAGFIRRAAAFSERGQSAEAIADLGKAITLQPNNAALYTDQGLAYMRNRQPMLALADFNQAIKLRPEATRALLARGELRMLTKDETGARADFEAALKATPAATGAVADLYSRNGLYEDAVATYDKLLDGRPVTEDLAHAFFLRCKARTFWGQDLDKAVADCNQAMKLMPGASEYWQIRGVAYLRQGKLDAAIADFNSALKLEPRDAWSLYARGVAEAKQGHADKSAGDIAAATALDPKLPAMAKGLGFGA